MHMGSIRAGVNYLETYALVFMWKTIRLILTLFIIKGWHSHKLDFVLAYP